MISSGVIVDCNSKTSIVDVNNTSGKIYVGARIPLKFCISSSTVDSCYAAQLWLYCSLCATTEDSLKAANSWSFVFCPLLGKCFNFKYESPGIQIRFVNAQVNKYYRELISSGEQWTSIPDLERSPVPSVLFSALVLHPNSISSPSLCSHPAQLCTAAVGQPSNSRPFLFTHCLFNRLPLRAPVQIGSASSRCPDANFTADMLFLCHSRTFATAAPSPHHPFLSVLSHLF